MKTENINSKEERGWRNLFLQIFQVKHFGTFTGGGLLFFATAYFQYFNNKELLAMVLLFFKIWGLVVFLWTIVLLMVYSGELENRIFIQLRKALKVIFPLSLVISALVLLLFPFDLKKTLGVLLLFILAFKSFNKPLRVISEKRIKVDKNKKEGLKVQTVEDWTATETSNLQGANFRELSLNGKRIRYLKFTVAPAPGLTYWRAGFKTTSSNDGMLPLLSSESFLFHVHPSTALGEGSLGVSWYIGGPDNAKHRVIKTEKTKKEKTIVIEMKINDKNFVSCLINGNVEFKKRLDPHWFEKAFIAAWGDGNPYRIEFSGIEYQLR